MAKKPRLPSQGPWYRMYVSILDNPKLARISEAQRWNWTLVLAVAVTYGGILPEDLTDVAHRLRKAVGKVRELFQVLLSAGLLERCEGGYVPHDWQSMQFDSDVSTNRVRELRERERNAQRNGDVTLHETTSERPHRQSTESETEKKKEVERASAPPDKGTRWPPDQVVSNEWVADADIQRHEHDLPRIDLRLEAKRFANYWSSRTRDATRLDWHKTWINWATDDSKRGTGKANGRVNEAGERGTSTDRHLAGISSLISEISDRKVAGGNERG